MSARERARPGRARRVTAEALGTAVLLAAVVGSGIMGERLAGGSVAVALLSNTLATGAALLALILTFGHISGAHFNPAVTLADASQGGLAWREVGPYVGAQVLGAFAGVAAAHVMFGEPLFAASRHARGGAAQMFGEFVATFGLLAVIWGCARGQRAASSVPFAVAAYIFAAAWFTSSTSFANPAVTLARSLTDTFSGIRPADVPGFIAAQLAGAGAATLLFRWLVPGLPEVAESVVVPREAGDEIPEAGRPAAAAQDARRRGKEMERMSEKKSVLILCTGNSARSQMAEGLLRHDAGGRFEVRSAGTRPAEVRPEAVRVMSEVGIDITGQRSKSVDEFAGQPFDYVITVCDNAREECPFFPALTERVHWGFEDPAAAPGSEAARVAVFRRVRDEIRERLREFAGA